MPNHNNKTRQKISGQPRFRQRAREIQAYGTVNHLPQLELEEPIRLEVTGRLNQLLADTMTLRDLYKKSHWQASGPTFYQLHLLFDKHFVEQVELVDSIAERVQILGGVSIAMAHDVAETTTIERPPRGREAVRSRFPACWMPIKPSLVRLATWRGWQRNWAMTAPMIFSSATSCAQTSCKCGP